jgi:hypothetical protein
MSKKHDHGGEELHFEQISHHGVAFEDRDLSGSAIFVFMIVLVVATAVIALGVWGYYVFNAHQIVQEPAMTGIQSSENTPANTPDPTKRFPSPVIQPDDQAEMRAFKQQQDETLTTYGWVDQNGGFVHIPIEAAIKEVAQKGLPARPQQPATTKAEFASGDGTPIGNAGGTRPVSRQ